MAIDLGFRSLGVAALTSIYPELVKWQLRIIYIRKRTGFLTGGIMALTKSDIVATVHELGFTKKKSVDIIETLLEIIKGSLEKNEDVLISGFGKFCVKDKNQRRGRNPATGADLILRERRVVTFKCSGKLRKKINGHF
jgi:integration host factor subunit alpha